MSTPSGSHHEHEPDRAGQAPQPGTEDVLTPPGGPANHREEAVPGEGTASREDTTGPAAGRRPAHGRSPWNRTRDRAVAVGLAVVTVAAGVVVWATGDSRATEQRTAAPPTPLPAAPAEVPPTLTERWRAPSPATPVPVAEGDTAVTAGQGRVVGRDPRTGEQRWHYARDLPLCTVGAGFSHAHALYRTEHNCSEVTQLDPATGRRTAQRNGNAEHGTRLILGDRHVTATGDRLLNTWRSDLVKTLEYGQVPAPVNPDRQPRTGCTYGTVATAAERVGVIERCPDESGSRLTVLKAAGEEADEPETEFSKMLPARDATLLALTEEAVAVALPRGELLVYDMDGMHQATHPVSVPGAELVRERADGVVPRAKGRGTVHVFTGSHTLALSADDLTPRWTAEGTLGPGTVFADRYVVPVRGGLAVLDDADGSTLRTVAVDRRDPDAPVRLTATGPVLLEQRGDTVVALG